MSSYTAGPGRREGKGLIDVDLEFDTGNEQFRAEVSAWPDENTPAGELSPPATVEGLWQQLEWERRLFDAGYAAPG
ncbi:hypothetical protein GCM10022222_10010 [Amycolatopsis ultiminotia]|uniref:Uncharacterized protein n=1 Tax=Amycolatopsis ultiminotia TaxID=543629 RepID=A0ABP6V8A2_9PSEU